MSDKILKTEELERVNGGLAVVSADDGFSNTTISRRVHSRSGKPINLYRTDAFDTPVYSLNNASKLDIYTIRQTCHSMSLKTPDISFYWVLYNGEWLALREDEITVNW